MSLRTTGFITLYCSGMTSVALQLLFMQQNQRVECSEILFQFFGAAQSSSILDGLWRGLLNDDDSVDLYPTQDYSQGGRSFGSAGSGCMTVGLACHLFAWQATSRAGQSVATSSDSVPSAS